MRAELAEHEGCPMLNMRAVNCLNMRPVKFSTTFSGHCWEIWGDLLYEFYVLLYCGVIVEYCQIIFRMPGAANPVLESLWSFFAELISLGGRGRAGL